MTSHYGRSILKKTTKKNNPISELDLTRHSKEEVVAVKSVVSQTSAEPACLALPNPDPKSNFNSNPYSPDPPLPPHRDHVVDGQLSREAVSTIEHLVRVRFRP